MGKLLWYSYKLQNFSPANLSLFTVYILKYSSRKLSPHSTTLLSASWSIVRSLTFTASLRLLFHWCSHSRWESRCNHANSYMFKWMLTWFIELLMHLSRLTLSWEDGIRTVGSYSVLLLVTWSPCCYLNV